MNMMQGCGKDSGKGKTKAMKPGDWTCPACGDHQFAKNMECRKCGTPNPDPDSSRAALEAGQAAGFGGAMEKPGDWYCPGCGDLQFAKNLKCRKCSTPNPDPEQCAALAAANGANMSGQAPQGKSGDWYCPNCNDLQFGRNAVCRKCGTPNPQEGGKGAMKGAIACGGKGKAGGAKGNVKPGDWFCSGCGDHQFANNTSCRQCGTPNFAAMVASMAQAGGMMGGGGGGMMGKFRAKPY